mmetsp:Transcript_35337/g.65803  ORF Transcript_35337/g.65803 Transcript_35337/m.65803 type:complete len:122 (-) Transcript_35337:200-565(-)
MTEKSAVSNLRHGEASSRRLEDLRVLCHVTGDLFGLGLTGVGLVGDSSKTLDTCGVTPHLLFLGEFGESGSCARFLFTGDEKFLSALRRWSEEGVATSQGIRQSWGAGLPLRRFSTTELVI